MGEITIRERQLFPGHFGSIGRAARESQMASWSVGQMSVRIFSLAFHSSIVAIPACKSEQALSGGAANEAGFSHSVLIPG
jgi:hypothetical protein